MCAEDHCGMSCLDDGGPRYQIGEQKNLPKGKRSFATPKDYTC